MSCRDQGSAWISCPHWDNLQPRSSGCLHGSSTLKCFISIRGLSWGWGNPPGPRGEDGFGRDLLLTTSAYHQRASSTQAKTLHTRLLQPAASQTHLYQIMTKGSHLLCLSQGTDPASHLCLLPGRALLPGSPESKSCFAGTPQLVASGKDDDVSSKSDQFNTEEIPRKQQACALASQIQYNLPHHLLLQQKLYLWLGIDFEQHMEKLCWLVLAFYPVSCGFSEPSVSVVAQPQQNQWH